jgi:Bacterial tandem repeat domain 1
LKIKQLNTSSQFLEASFNALWQDLIVKKNFSIAEHVSYMRNGKRLHAGVIVDRPSDNSFNLFYGLNDNDFGTKFGELYNKWEMKSVHNSGSGYGGVWRLKKNDYATYLNMTPEDFQNKYNQFVGQQGLRLIKLQNHNNNTRFTAIWGR